MKVEEVLTLPNVGKRFSFEWDGKTVETSVKRQYINGYLKISLDFLDGIEFTEIIESKKRKGENEL